MTAPLGFDMLFLSSCSKAASISASLFSSADFSAANAAKAVSARAVLRVLRALSIGLSDRAEFGTSLRALAGSSLIVSLTLRNERAEFGSSG